MNNSFFKEKLNDRIIRAAYGDAGFLEKISVYLAARRDPAVAALLKEYRQTAEAVHSMEKECPEYLVNTAEEKLLLKSKSNSAKGILSALMYKPSLAFIMIILFSGILSFFIFRGNNEPDYSAAEVELAEKQVKETLSYVGIIFKAAENELEKEILEKKISKPIRKGFSTVNFLIGG
jgi:hypothetical protein